MISHVAFGSQGPSSFEVRGKNGLIYHYGDTPTSSVWYKESQHIKRAWLVNRIEDRFGNYIDIDYEQNYDSGRCDVPPVDGVAGACAPFPKDNVIETFPMAISYGGNVNGQEPDRWISFSYSDSREDPQYGYSEGSSFAKSRLLERIETFVRGNLVRSYQLSYEHGLVNRSRISTLTLCAQPEQGGALACLPETKITYRDTSAHIWSTADNAQEQFVSPDVKTDASTIRLETIEGEAIKPGDFNGDGLQDTVRVVKVNETTVALPHQFAQRTSPAPAQFQRSRSRC